MADTLNRETSPPAGQIASPTPQYEVDGKPGEWERVRGKEGSGAPYAALTDVDGNPLGTESNPFRVKASTLETLIQTLGREATLELIKSGLDSLNLKDFATQTTLAEILQRLQAIEESTGIKKIVDAVDVSDRAERELGKVQLSGRIATGGEQRKYYWGELELDRNMPSDPILDYTVPVIIERLEWAANFPDGVGEHEDSGAMLLLRNRQSDGTYDESMSRAIVWRDGQVNDIGVGDFLTRHRITPKLIKNHGHSWFDLVHYDEKEAEYKVALNQPLHFPNGLQLLFVNTTGTPEGTLGRVGYNIDVRELVLND